MPKAAKQTRSAKRAAQRATAITKPITFTFAGRKHEAEISRHDKPAAIYASIRAALTGICSDIIITDQDGEKLVLEYGHLKKNGNIHVHRASERSQGPDDCTPCALNLQGKRVSFLDQERSMLRPTEWSGKFVHALYKLSIKTVGRHEAALSTMMAVATARQNNKKHQHTMVREIVTQDIVLANNEMGSGLVDVAEEAVEVMDTETFAGGLMEGIEEVAKQVEAAAAEKAEPKELPTFEVAFKH
jgi:hypothetical protein